METIVQELVDQKEIRAILDWMIEKNGINIGNKRLYQ